MHTFGNAGVYDVYLGVTSPLGCFVDTTFRRLIDVRESPVADFQLSPEQPSTTLPEFRVFRPQCRLQCAAGTRSLMSLENSSSLRRSPTSSTVLRDTSTVSITQVVTHPSGCRDTLTKDIRLRLENTIHTPTAFTPNGDGLNDRCGLRASGSALPPTSCASGTAGAKWSSLPTTSRAAGTVPSRGATARAAATCGTLGSPMQKGKPKPLKGGWC